MPDEPEILRDLVTPVQPVRRPGNDRSRGMREGLALAVILVLAALAAGVLAVPRLPAGASPAASADALTSTAGASPSGLPTDSAVPPTPDVAPTPAVTPVRPCAAAASLPDELFFAKLITNGQWFGQPLADAWMAQPLPESPQGDPDGPEVAPGDPIILSTELGACALAWNITLNGAPVAIQDNPLHDPAYAAQNYFVLTLPPTRDPDPRLRAELLFSRGWTGTEWTIHLRPSPIPAAFFSALDQTIEAAPGCGFNVALASGTAIADECATTIPESYAGPYSLYAPPFSLVGFRVPNAAFVPIEGDPVRCGTVGGSPPDFKADSRCSIELASDPSNALSFWAPTRGVWWIEVLGCAKHDGNSACGIWFLMLDTADPQPSDPPIY